MFPDVFISRICPRERTVFIFEGATCFASPTANMDSNRCGEIGTQPVRNTTCKIYCTYVSPWIRHTMHTLLHKYATPPVQHLYVMSHVCYTPHTCQHPYATTHIRYTTCMSRHVYVTPFVCFGIRVVLGWRTRRPTILLPGWTDFFPSYYPS